MLIDTDILIGVQRGLATCADALDRIPAPQRRISAITWMEFIQGATNADQMRRSIQFLERQRITVIHPDAVISARAMDYMQRFTLSHGMQTMDAIIAATASVHELSVVTMNAKHYRHVPGIRMVTVRGA